jgi:hypothetical protein
VSSRSTFIGGVAGLQHLTHYGLSIVRIRRSSDASGQQMMESVNTLMTVTTFPQDEEENGK